ncbi:MAG: thiamine pyrophosphate-dependent acetolactate synthase large subunit-like protein [Parasphingorhabdus sp.]|jgi:thiamine pyrophosphate-dependent acetolactate synthase large subunit-like protein
MLNRRPLLDYLLQDRPEYLLAVASLGSPAWDLTSIGEHDGNFCFVGAMGQAGPFALGLAMARPQHRVVLFAGDGELLMGIGALTCIANQQPKNLVIIALDNGCYSETGGQPTATSGHSDLGTIASGCGFQRVTTISNPKEKEVLKHTMLHQPGPVFANVKIASGRDPLALPQDLDGAAAINRFRQFTGVS